MSEVRIVLVTAPDDASAAALSRELVAERLIACANLVPGVRSIFRWEGTVEDETESLVVFKTTDSRVPALLQRIPELHPYDVPEVLVLDVDAGHPAYLEWVGRETESGPASER